MSIQLGIALIFLITEIIIDKIYADNPIMKIVFSHSTERKLKNDLPSIISSKFGIRISDSLIPQPILLICHSI